MFRRPAGKTKTKKPTFTLTVYKKARKVGVESVRISQGEENRYLSTDAKIRDRGRRYGFRTHAVLDKAGALVTYDRWIDIKGATLRRRVFAFKKAWKLVDFGQPGRKRELTELGVKHLDLVLDGRSPSLVALAVDRFKSSGGKALAWADAERGKTGQLTIQAVPSVNEAGEKFTRFAITGTLGAKAVTMSVVHDAAGLVVAVDGLDGYRGRAKGVKVGKLTPASDAPVAPPADSAGKEGDAPKDAGKDSVSKDSAAKPAPKKADAAPAKDSGAPKDSPKK